MGRARLYLDFGQGYKKDNASTTEEIIERLEEVHNDIYKYLVVQRKNNCDEILAFGFGNIEEIQELNKTLRKEKSDGERIRKSD
nr:MAG TPA: hypothetical protein [Bacteriophage sp.]